MCAYSSKPAIAVGDLIAASRFGAVINRVPKRKTRSFTPVAQQTITITLVASFVWVVVAVERDAVIAARASYIKPVGQPLVRSLSASLCFCAF